MSQVQTLENKFKETILPDLQKRLGFKNVHSAPKIEKVVVNVGIGSFVSSGNKDYSGIVKNIALITGQQPVVTKSKKAISNFKLRIGMPVGVTSTLRGDKMYSFIQRLVNIALPRVRDFRGINKKSFDGHGNYHIGIKECTIFPEINPDDLSKVHGLEISIVTTAKTDEHGFELLKDLGFPFQKAPKTNE